MVSCKNAHLLYADEAQVLCHEHAVSRVVGAQAMLVAALPDHLLPVTFKALSPHRSRLDGMVSASWRVVAAQLHELWDKRHFDRSCTLMVKPLHCCETAPWPACAAAFSGTLCPAVRAPTGLFPAPIRQRTGHGCHPQGRLAQERQQSEAGDIPANHCKPKPPASVCVTLPAQQS